MFCEQGWGNTYALTKWMGSHSLMAVKAILKFGQFLYVCSSYSLSLAQKNWYYRTNLVEYSTFIQIEHYLVVPHLFLYFYFCCLEVTSGSIQCLLLVVCLFFMDFRDLLKYLICFELVFVSLILSEIVHYVFLKYIHYHCLPLELIFYFSLSLFLFLFSHVPSLSFPSISFFSLLTP